MTEYSAKYADYMIALTAIRGGDLMDALDCLRAFVSEAQAPGEATREENRQLRKALEDIRDGGEDISRSYPSEAGRALERIYPQPPPPICNSPVGGATCAQDQGHTGECFELPF